MPYLPVDPADIGETYEAVIRVNSQSGKGGIAWVVEQDKGQKLPRSLQIDLSRRVQDFADSSGKEITAAMIWSIFEEAYHLTGPQEFELVSYQGGSSHKAGNQSVFAGRIRHKGREIAITGRGNVLISSALWALEEGCGVALEVLDYHEHALKRGTDSQAVAYLECRAPDGRKVFGAGIDDDIATASIKAVLSAASND